MDEKEKRSMGSEIRIDRKQLEQFCTDVFMKLGLSLEEASDSAEILLPPMPAASPAMGGPLVAL